MLGGGGAGRALVPLMEALRESTTLCRAKREMKLLVRGHQALGVVRELMRRLLCHYDGSETAPILIPR